MALRFGVDTLTDGLKMFQSIRFQHHSVLYAIRRTVLTFSLLQDKELRGVCRKSEKATVKQWGDCGGLRPMCVPASGASRGPTKGIQMLATLLLVASCQGGEATTPSVDAELRPADEGAAPNFPGEAELPVIAAAEIEKLLNGAQPGDVVLVPPGTYNGTLEIAVSGGNRRPITVRPQSPGTVIIDGTDSPTDSDLVTLSGDNVVFEGFTIRNANRSGISVWGAQGVVIRGNTVTGSRLAGIWAGHGHPGEVTDIVVDSNIVAWNGLDNSERTRSKGWPRAIAVDLASDVRIVNNRVHSNYGEGIGLLSSFDAVIADNQLSDNFSVNIYLDNTRDIVVTRNSIWHTGNREFFRSGRPAYGIMIANEFVDHPIQSENIRVQYNRLRDVGAPFYSAFEAGGGLRNGLLEPNIILGKP